MPNRLWYVAYQGQQQGPYPEDQFRDFIATGRIRPDMMVWSEGMADWQKAAEVPGLMPQGTRPPAMLGRAAVASRPVATDGGGGGQISVDLPLWPFFGRGLLVGIGSLLVIPSPWTAMSFYQWILPRFHVPGRPNLAFEGKVGDIWYVFILLGLTAYIGRIHSALQLVGFVAQAVLAWMLLRYILSRLSSNGQLLGLEFNGSIWGYLGWHLLMGVSIITVIGWAWVATAWVRWICKNIGGSRRELTFGASGLEFLWRTLVLVVGCVFLIPIPWLMRWYTQWIVSQLALAEPGTYVNA